MSGDLRAVAGYEGRYSVTNDGNVWSHYRTIAGPFGATIPFGDRWLTRQLNHDGYPVVTLSLDGVAKEWRVHRLVALAWKPNDDHARIQINHKNGIKIDCRAENLEWCTPRENSVHAIATGLCPITARSQEARSRSGLAKRKLTFEQAEEVRIRVASGAIQNRLAVEFGVTRGAIFQIVKGKTYRRKAGALGLA